MATDIGPKVGLASTREFKKELSEINTAMRTLKTEMDAVTSATDKNDRSTEKLMKENQGLAKVLRGLWAERTKANQAIETATNVFGKNSEEVQKAQQIYNKLTTEINNVTQTIRSNRAEIQSNNDALKESGEESKSALARFLEMGDAVDSLAAILATAGVAKLVNEISDALKACVESAIEFEYAIAGVRRTVGGTEEEIKAIADGMSELSKVIPISTTALGKIGETAGQLGIAREDVLLFTEIMAKLATSTDLTADNAATMLAQFANITGLNPADYDRLGATVAALGDATATTASKVVDLSQGLAASASIAGFKETDILAVAAAVGSLGIEAQAGSTAMSALIQNIHKAVELGSDELQDFASIADMSANEFAQAWGNDPVRAMDAFIQGLNDTERNGRSAMVLLDELGFNNQRQIKAISGLAEAEGLLASTIDQASRAWEENTALEDKAAIMYQTLASKQQLLANSVDLLKSAIGAELMPVITSLTNAGAEAAQGAAEFVEQNGWIVPAVTAAATALGVLTAGVVGYTAAAKLASTATKILKTALVTSAFGPVLIAVAAVTAAVVGLTIALAENESAARKHERALKDSKKAAQEWQESFDSKAEAVESTMFALRQLVITTNRSTAEQEALVQTVDELNQLYPELSLSINEATGQLEQSIPHIRTFIEEQMRQEEATQKVRELIEAERLYQQTLEDLAAVQADLAEKGERQGHSRGEMIGVTTGLAAEEEKLLAVLRTLTEEYPELKRTTDEYADSLDGTGDSTEEVAKKAKFLKGSIEELEKKYLAAQEAARASIQGQFDQWELVDNKAKTSVRELQKAIESQTRFINNYGDNLTHLMSRNVEGVEKLGPIFSEMTTKNGAALEAFRQVSDEEVAAYLEAVEKLENAEIDAEKPLADAAIGYTRQLDELRDENEQFIEDMDAKEEMFQSAVNTLRGYINGLNNQTGPLEAKMLSLAAMIATTLPKELKMRSPSKLFESYGVNTLQGYINGLEEMGDPVNETLKALAKEAEAAFQVEFYSATKYEAAKKALDQALKMNIIAERRYYEELEALRNAYLRGAKHKDEYRSVTAELYQFEMETLTEQLENFEDARDKALKEYEDLLEGIAATAEKQLGAIEKQMESLSNAEAAMVKKLTDSIDLFDARTVSFNDGSKRDLFDLADLDAQIETLKEYEGVLDGLRNRGLDDSLMQRVGTMGVEDAIRYGKEMLEQSEEAFAEYNRDWKEIERLTGRIGEKFYKSEMDGLEKEYRDTLDASLAELARVAEENGEDTVQGLIDGMKSKEDELRAQIAEIAKLVEEGFRAELKINSPSKAMQPPSSFMSAGFAVGGEADVSRLSDAVLAAIPSFDMPQAATQDNVAAQVLGAITPMIDAALAQPQPANISIQIGGIELARAVLPDIRQAAAESPQPIRDF